MQNKIYINMHTYVTSKHACICMYMHKYAARNIQRICINMQIKNMQII